MMLTINFTLTYNDDPLPSTLPIPLTIYSYNDDPLPFIAIMMTPYHL